MSMANLAWVVLLECLRAEDWDTAWALVNLVEVTVPHRQLGPADFDAHASSRPPEMRGKLVSRTLGVEGEAWVQRHLVDPLCIHVPPEKRPTFKVIEPLAASYEAVDQAGRLHRRPGRGRRRGSTMTRELEPCTWCDGTGFIPETGVMCGTCLGRGTKP